MFTTSVTSLTFVIFGYAVFHMHVRSAKFFHSKITEETNRGFEFPTIDSLHHYLGNDLLFY